jgi:hypothetical protein
MLILRAVVHEQQHSPRRQAVDEIVEQGLRLGVDPVKVLEEERHRLHLALAKDEVLDGVEYSLAALRRAQCLPLRIGDRDPEEREERGYRAAEALVEREHLAGDLFLDRASAVSVIDFEVHPEQIDEGQVRRRLAVGDGG